MYLTKNNEKFLHLLYHNWVSSSVDEYSSEKDKCSSLYVSSSCFKRNFNFHLPARKIDDNYICICSLYNNQNKMSKGGINIQNVMLHLHKENTASLNKTLQGIFPTFMLASLLNLNSFVF